PREDAGGGATRKISSIWYIPILSRETNKNEGVSGGTVARTRPRAMQSDRATTTIALDESWCIFSLTISNFLVCTIDDTQMKETAINNSPEARATTLSSRYRTRNILLYRTGERRNGSTP